MPRGYIGEWKYRSTMLDLGTNEDEWSAVRPGRFTSEQKALGIHCIWSWFVPRACLEDVKRKISGPWQESKLGRPARSPPLCQLSYPRSRSIWIQSLFTLLQGSYETHTLSGQDAELFVIEGRVCNTHCVLCVGSINIVPSPCLRSLPHSTLRIILTIGL
jgi:hypothetical protein